MKFALVIKSVRMEKMIIGIDPDVDKSGFAFLQGNKLQLKNLTFLEIFEILEFHKEKTNKPKVYIEMGSLNKSNWHTKSNKSEKYNAKIGSDTGRNF